MVINALMGLRGGGGNQCINRIKRGGGNQCIDGIKWGWW